MSSATTSVYAACPVRLRLFNVFSSVANKKQCPSVQKGRRCAETDKKEKSLDEKCRWLSETMRLA